LIFCLVSAEAQSNNAIAFGQSVNVTNYGICRKITNADSSSLHLNLSFSTKGEWENFIGSSHNGIRIEKCTDPCVEGEVGTRCLDGTVYVGVIEGRRIYAAPKPEKEVPWTQSSRTYSATKAISVSDGFANTDTILARSRNEYTAALACREKGPEWYLPALAELNTIIAYQYRVAASDAPTDGTAAFYWSSTEVADDSAYGIQFNEDRLFTPIVKTIPLPVWCAKK